MAESGKESSPPSSSSSSDPPLEKAYKKLVVDNEFNNNKHQTNGANDEILAADYDESELLPLIDLSDLTSGGEIAREECKSEIARASHEWGFFQVVNHGISREILETMRREEMRLFKKPFHEKTFNFSAGSYRWGSPVAKSRREFSWSEAFHVHLGDIFDDGDSPNHQLSSSTMSLAAKELYSLGQRLGCPILAEKVGEKRTTFLQETCLLTNCYIRMNRYPPNTCPVMTSSFGLMPHTDSDFFTILHQDDVGGLELVRDGRWVGVRPNADALIINIGDLFQAWSNGIYRSVEHRVVTNNTRERFSTAFFLCPSHDTVIHTSFKPCLYRRFSFGEFKKQVQEDVNKFGRKIGLPRFLV